MIVRRDNSADVSVQRNRSPTAQRLLEGARRLMEREGYSSLTLEAIAREAGETKSLIRYYFGSKRGLLVALVDWVMHEETEVQRRIVAERWDGDRRLQALVETLVPMMLDAPSYRNYFDLMPHVLRDPQMRVQAAALFATWRHLTVAGLLPSSADGIPKEVMTLASMTIAVADGLALQLLADPASVDVRQAMGIWETYLTHILSGSGRQTAGDVDEVLTAESSPPTS